MLLSCAPQILPVLPAPSVLPLTLVNVYTGNSSLSPRDPCQTLLKRAFLAHVLLTGAQSSSDKASTSHPLVSSFRHRSLAGRAVTLTRPAEEDTGA